MELAAELASLDASTCSLTCLALCAYCEVQISS